MTPVPTQVLATRAVVLACAVAAVLPGCTLLGRKVRECEGFDVPLSVFVGPSRKELRSRVVASGVDETFPFVAEANAESMVIVGFTPLGTKSFTLTRKADDVEVDNVLGAGLRVSPRNVMADVLAMSLPSSCATAPDGDSPSNFDSWRVTDTCSDNRPVKRTIAKAAKEGETPAVEVEVEYRPEAIVVRQKQCKYTAAYVLQASQPIPGVDVKKGDADEATQAAPLPPAAPSAQPAAPAPSATAPAVPTPPAAATPAQPAPPAPAPQPASPVAPTVTPPAAPPKKPPILAPSPGGSPILVPAN